MPVKLMPPGNISNSQQVVVNTGASTTMSGSSGTGQQTSTPSTSDDVVLAIDNLRVMLEHKEQYDVIPNTVHAPDYNVTDAMFVDSDVRLFAYNIALSGTLLVRKNGFAQVFSSLEVNGIVDNFSVLEIGVGDVM